jgi:hypothetical protein
MTDAEEVVDDDLLAVDESVAFSGISQTALYEMMRQGLVAYVRRDDCAKRLIPRRELIAVLASNLVSERPLSGVDRDELCAEGACSVGEAASGPFKRTTLFKLIKAGELPVVKVPGCDPLVPRVALRRLAAAGLKPSRPPTPLTPEADAALAEMAAAHGVSPAEMAAEAIAARLRALKAEVGAAEFQRMVAVGRAEAAKEAKGET